MDLRVTIPWNPWNGTIAHRDHMPRLESGRWRIDDEPRDLADVGIVGDRIVAVAQGNGQRLGLAIEWHLGSWWETLLPGKLLRNLAK
jgi:hypothetical protein